MERPPQDKQPVVALSTRQQRMQGVPHQRCQTPGRAATIPGQQAPQARRGCSDVIFASSSNTRTR